MQHISYFAVMSRLKDWDQANSVNLLEPIGSIIYVPPALTY
jgi:hypothetical protein